MRYRPLSVTVICLVALGLMLTGAGCKKTPSSPDPIDPNDDGEIDFLELVGVVTAVDREMTFAHVQPGEYSEVYLRFRTSPDARFEATLSGPSVASPATQRLRADERGFVRFVWRVYSLGRYRADVYAYSPGDPPGFAFSKAITVQ